MDTVTNLRQQVSTDWANDETAAAWQKYYETMRDQLGPVTAALIEGARPASGMEVLDLASGTGEPAIPLARSVAPAGNVTATDFNPAMLAALRHNASVQGVENIDTRVADGENLPFEDATFDLVTSRFGAMFFIEIGKALNEIRRVLRPGGRVALAVWGAATPGTYFGDLVVPFVQRLPDKPDPDGPGPMRFAEPGKLAKEMVRAGFTDVREQVLSLPTKWPGSPEEALSAVFELAAPLRNAVATLSDANRQAATQEVYERLRPKFDGTHTHTLAPVLILTGTA